MLTMKRKIQFFKVDMYCLNSENNLLERVRDQTERANTVFNYIGGLTFDHVANSNRYYRFSNGNEMSMYVDQFYNNRIVGRIVTCRRNQLPDVEDAGVLSALPIPNQAGLAEITHFIYYFQTQIVGMEFNFYGPKAGNLKTYLEEKSNGEISQFLITPVIRPDLDPILNNPDLEISMFEVEAHRNAGEVLKDLNKNLGVAFKVASSASEAETVEIILRKKAYSRSGFWGGFLNIGALMDRFRLSDRDKFNKLKMNVVDPKNRKVKPIDLLADKLTLTKDIEYINGRRKSIQSASMYREIDNAYNELRSQLIISNRG